MSQEFETLNSNTRKEKFLIFFKENKKKLILFIFVLILLLISYFTLSELNDRKTIETADKYNKAIIAYEEGKLSNSKEVFEEIIKRKHKTYSVLAFYHLLDNNIISSNQEINLYFDFIINEINLDQEFKNLIIYKKALFNSEYVSENELIGLLNPVIKSESVWRSHGLILIAKYLINKNENQKAKEFLDNIINSENANINIKNEAQKILQTKYNN